MRTTQRPECFGTYVGIIAERGVGETLNPEFFARIVRCLHELRHDLSGSRILQRFQERTFSNSSSLVLHRGPATRRSAAVPLAGALELVAPTDAPAQSVRLGEPQDHLFCFFRRKLFFS